MADEPISTSVPEIVTVDTGADPKDTESLNDAFASFWTETDSKESLNAPPAPGEEGPAQETKTESKAEPKEEAKPVSVESPAKAPEPLPASDDDIDRMQMANDAQPHLVDDFKKIKDLWKADRAKMRAEASRAVKLEQELAQAKANAWTPEAKADYEHAASIRRKFDFASDPEFQQRYHQPVINKYAQVLEEAVNVLPDRQAAMAWAQQIANNYSPDSLDRNWWLHSVIEKVPDEMDRQALLGSVTELLKLQRTRDMELHSRSTDKSAFDSWIKEKTDTTARRVQEEIMTEIGVQERRIAEVLPKNIDEAKTKEEREAISVHNERFEKLNAFFKDTMKDLSAHGPRAWVRASVEATRAQLLDQELQKLQDELKSTKSERDKYKGELDKIAGARRRISSTAGTPPSAPAKKDGTLSIKDLDVRRSFDKFDWGDNT